MTIHKEGFSSLIITLVFLFTLNGAILYFFPENLIVHYIFWGASFVFFLLILQFFRNPKVFSEINPKLVLAPADGKVVVIEDVLETEYFNETRKQISIFMSPINVHINRNPVSGVVKYFKYHAGKYLVAWHPKSSTENERTTIVIKNENGIEVLMRQIAGALAKRIKWYVEEGQNVVQGNEFGFIKFGSRVDVFLPVDAKVNVEINQKTKGGKTVIAELP
ncbi:phosphatidylserine decarboxylase family protein [Flexithrix dorotheae]|uniref:phosphatidylserine decarboxylase family protein n=1 Tax=Flexithrix dorotheae TaxID=70993 RepID=UPI00035D503E|nr:phosphatidylserine decarboxylase family protein [Flexithrix dorotheae]